MKGLLVVAVLFFLLGCGGATVIVPADGSTDLNGGAYGHNVGIA